MKAPLSEAVRKSVLLNGLSEEVRDRLLKDSVQRSYAEGETIFLQGDPARAVFIVLRGFVKLSRMTPGGAEAVVSILGRNRSFAEAMALRGTPYPVTAEAISDCTLLQIDGTRLRHVLLENPEFAIGLLASTFVHFQALVNQIENLKAHTGVQRVAQFLSTLTEAESGPCEVALPYNKRLIAGNLGMQPESLSRAFARLREHGVKVDSSKAVIDDIAQLRLLAQD
ncbi:cAMP-binding domain of CRP or a regulatory subunit of cAMP-dependent protein kinases [Paracoccus halophilus]|uniref:Cyclic nucleotide-binding protein n=1 Tax=Paracoccus halophilus TaxID=376733 RepID=A0A099F4S9_9RHOB|nr:cyclic nucleotide-binding domain-containing protein [Paracoccus halophilus]KGJ05419.1 cyclic nucleotide-binding protein [Paracoccus halophilus]SFA49127.1 cAMP-binding domain of CRP or a regulatory subunit of cAMP-dependent protein kinases [Paracoccus halophilus]